MAYSDWHYQPGTIDLRSLHILNGGLFMSSAFVNEPNKNGDKAPYTPWVSEEQWTVNGQAIKRDALTHGDGRLACRSIIF